jgi:hypothetical protein
MNKTLLRYHRSPTDDGTPFGQAFSPSNAFSRPVISDKVFGSQARQAYFVNVFERRLVVHVERIGMGWHPKTSHERSFSLFGQLVRC